MCLSQRPPMIARSSPDFGWPRNRYGAAVVIAINLKLRLQFKFEAMNAPEEVAIKEKRSSARINAPYPVRLRGVDSNGEAFKEETLMDNLSGGGLYIRLKRAPREG